MSPKSPYKHLLPLGLASAVAAAAWLPAPDVHAFCGFYVAGGDASLFNDATQVVLMREGTKTVLSMQNNYRGPLGDFALVVPVPVVLKEQNVKTLKADVFKKVDTLSAPRLVEYWEQDPCAAQGNEERFAGPSAAKGGSLPGGSVDDKGPVKIEAQFTVGEYEIVILSATEATALESWLVKNAYKIPAGATKVFDQYIQQGMYFFVAKVNPAKVSFKNDQAVLSPLRFDYESKDFALPVRLGLINSGGEQDLIVHILSREGRYEVANAPNVTVPTNIEVTSDVRKDFGTFYTKLFSETVARTPRAVVTEYSWDASSCDPCPGPTLDPTDLSTLGADALSSAMPSGAGKGGFSSGFTLTRLHARYGAAGLGDDFIFKKAVGIAGGRENWNKDRIENGAVVSEGFNNFQGRYIMRNRWRGAVTCKTPRFGVWGGPPEGSPAARKTASALGPNSGGVAKAASDSPLFARTLDTLVAEPVPEIGVVPKASTSGCNCSLGGAAGGGALGVFALAGLIGRLVRRKR